MAYFYSFYHHFLLIWENWLHLPPLLSSTIFTKLRHMFTLSKYLPLPPLICKYIAQIMYIPSIMSLVFVLSFAKLKETNERNRFYSASMDEVFLRKKLFFAKLSLTYFNEYINFAFFSYWIANHEIFRIFYTFMCFFKKEAHFCQA